MFIQMVIDSLPDFASSVHCHSILQRLSLVGIPEDNLNRGQSGLVAFAKDNGSSIPVLVAAILPPEEDDNEDAFRESMVWLQWLMFEGEPQAALEHLASQSADQQGVCGAIWGSNDIAYRCRTCENDPTCAICVPCFENGNHEDHDYSVIYTGGGCCDCGDITAWKRKGFCSKHKGAEQIQPLPDSVAKTVGPVLGSLLSYWKTKLLAANHVPQKAADSLTSAVVKMLLDFCKHSDSLLNFISGRVYSSAGLLDILLRAERFINDSVEKLHELLLKLLGEPVFKYEFAKVFVVYYPSVIDAAISKCSDAALKEYPLLPTFSVQILTVPTLTPRLVEEMNLLDMLFHCLENMFNSCAREDGRLQVDKWANLYETTVRVIEDIRFVMSHSAVPKYICQKRRELVRTWMRLLASVQGMNAQKRQMGSHIEDENENIHLPFVLCHYMSNILSLLVAGAFSVSTDEDTNDEIFFNSHKLECEDEYSLRHAKVGRLTQESPIRCIIGKSVLDHETKVAGCFPIPYSAVWLLNECLRSIENWLESNKTVSPLSAFGVRFDSGQPMVQEAGAGNSDDHLLEEEHSSEFEGLKFLSQSGWPDISYDVTSQDISIHIPLHRLLSMVLLRALKECYGEYGSSYVICDSSPSQSFPTYGDLLCQILEGCHPYGFSACAMEHPLRIRVFCAEVRAGMWRRNGDVPILFREWYRSVRWSEQGQELDLFLLQCCAALAPPDLFVQRILDRFGLSNYLSLNLEQPSEQEPILVAEMLTLLVQIVKERRFCGLTAGECLQRELVHKLSIGDATRSQLVKSLPRDLSKNNKLQEVLDTVAEYSHPSGMTQGTYKLRSQYWKELDLYHPRWNSRDQQAAEDRYLRFCNVSALISQLPRWTKIYHPLREIAKVATCKTLVQLVRAVLFYAVFTDKVTTSRAPDGVLITALHLLALALDVCQVQRGTSDSLGYLGDVIPLLEFACEETCTSKYGDHSMLSLLVLLMNMHDKEIAESFAEPGDFSMSSLLHNIIKTFVELEPRCIATLQKIAPQLANQFSHSTLKIDAKDIEPDSDFEKSKAKSRERQAAVLDNLRAQQSKFLESFNSDVDDEMDGAKSESEASDFELADDSEKSAPVTCALCHDPQSKDPISFLVLLQKSRLSSFVGREPPTWERVGRSGKEHVFDSIDTITDISPGSILNSAEVNGSSELELVKSALNDFASIGQPREVLAFVEFVKARFPSIMNVQLPCMSKDARERAACSLKAWEEEIYAFIRGSGSSLNVFDLQEADAKCPTAAGSSAQTKATAESLLLGKYIAALPTETLDHSSAPQNDHSQSDRMHSESSALHAGNDKFGLSGGDGIYVSSCGHAVHQSCLDRYLSSVRERYIRRIVFEGRQILDPDQGEFLCPVCRGLANSVLPALSRDVIKVPHTPAGPAIRFMNASTPSSSSDTEGSLLLHDALLLLQRAADIAGSSEILSALPATDVRTQPSLEPTLHLLCGMYYPGQKNILESGRVSHSLIMWDTLKYSITSAEVASRSRKSSLIPNYSLGALYKELDSSSGFTLSLLLNFTQRARTTDFPTVLLRIQLMQLFAKSICYGSSPNPSSNSFYGQGVNAMLYILENAEEVRYPDIQLCRQATKPVLVHDSFSSLMWMLFCLPWPLLSCRESFLPLVHIFYLVTVTQAIIAYCKKGQRIESDLESHDSLITDIYRVMRQCEEAVQCFDSYSVNPAYDIKDSIRSLAFPYLRRCALLWKLITCPNLSPYGDGAANGLKCETNCLEELPEVEKLEKMFNIPSLAVIINDEKSRLTALRWISHFSEAFEAHNQHVLTCAPAVPFKLLILPHRYQDLLQRYIKKCCPYCGTVKDEPALCLMCGRLCSPNWKVCCRESGCQTHAMACGAGIGVFLLIKRTTILLQRSARQAPWPSLYLDAFGEEDVEMHRGKPLFLNEERYSALTHMVASHGLDRSSKVLRQTTLGSFFTL